jgi:LSD1 subclass zinc finger protein
LSQPEEGNVQTSPPAVPQPPPWRDALLLDDGELVQTSWHGDHSIEEMAVVNGRNQMVEVRKHGFLVLTSRKLVFMEERGVFNKSYHLDCGIQLESIEGISMGGLLMKYVSIGSAVGENKFHVDGVDAKTFETYKEAIMSQIGLRKQEIEQEKARESVQAMLDFSFLREYMTKGGISVEAVKCPQCRAPLTMPENGSFVKCNYCGATVYASDLMDRVKQLIG